MNRNMTYNGISLDVNKRAYLLLLNEQKAEFYLPNTFLLIVYLIVGSIGNVAVILVYQFRLKKQTDGRYFIAPLAWFDLIALVVTVTFNLIQNTKQVMFPGFEACTLLVYFSYVTTCASLYLLAAIAVQRYLKICRPFGRQMNLCWKRASVFFCAIISATVYIPVLFHYGVIENMDLEFGNITVYQCSKLPGSPSQLRKLRIFQGFGFFGTLCNVVLITALYTLITTTIVKQIRKMKKVQVKSDESSVITSDETTSSSHASKCKHGAESVHTSNMESNVDMSNTMTCNKTSKLDTNKSAFRISFMFMTISIVGLVAYLPSWVLIVMETNNPSFWKQLPVAALNVCLTLRRMYIINHLANPFIYGLFDTTFRKEITKCFCQK